MPARPTYPLAAAGFVALVAAFSAPSEAAHAPVAVFPAAGTKVASPKTQISFRGATPGELTGIKVRGSSTGSHSGKLKAHSDGQGASFLLNQPFKRGEQVTVSADVSLVGAQGGVVKFTISSPPGPYTLKSPGDPGGTPAGAQRFQSRTDLQPPSIRITRREPSARGEGDLFVAPKAGPGQNGLQIADEQGRLVWFKRIGGTDSAFDFRAQSYRGKPVLTWWQGRVRSGQGLGVGHIVDSSYRSVATVKAGNGYRADLHEFEISSRSTALLLAYEPVTYGGKTMMDTIVQEVDIPTGLVMFEFHALGQVSPSESYIRPAKAAPIDIAHLNSIELEPDGNLLVSARNTYAVYEIGTTTGKIVWRVGGKRSDFNLTAASRFKAQHHVRLQPDGSITLFDNGGPPPPGRESRALWLNVNEGNRTVSVRRAYRYPQAIHTLSQGSMQVMPSGSVFVGWGGDEPGFTEFTKGGKIVFDGHFDPTGDDSYRAYRAPWSARPAAPPDIAAKNAGGKTIVYASWNGATEVARWEVLAGPAAGALVSVKKVDRSGFETTVGLGGKQSYVAVRALDSNGQTLGTSATVRPTG